MVFKKALSLLMLVALIGSADVVDARRTTSRSATPKKTTKTDTTRKVIVKKPAPVRVVNV